MELSAVIGASVNWDSIYQLNPERPSGCLTIVLGGEIIAQGKRLAFVQATDQTGRPIELCEPLSEAHQLRSRFFIPYSLNLRLPAGARELNVTLGVSRSRFIEFVAKPEQVK